MKLSLEYIAGFVDGDGCIFLTKREHRTYKWRTKYVSLSCGFNIANCNKTILEEIRAFFNIGKVYPLYRHNHPKWKQWFGYQVNGLKIRTVLEKLAPLLRVKRKQAKLVLQFIRIREEQFKETNWKNGQRCPYDSRLFGLQEEVSALNKRGPD